MREEVSGKIRKPGPLFPSNLAVETSQHIQELESNVKRDNAKVFHRNFDLCAISRKYTCEENQRKTQGSDSP